MARTTIDNILFNLFSATFYFAESTTYQRAYADIEWYVNTERASTAWLKALAKADPKKVLRRVGSQISSTDEVISGTTAYLKRYCGLQ